MKIKSTIFNQLTTAFVGNYVISHYSLKRNIYQHLIVNFYVDIRLNAYIISI